MAKTLGAKSRIIRAAITANPEKSNKLLAEMLNDSQDRLDDKITFTANDIAQQKQAIKKPGAEKAEAVAAASEPAPTPVAAPDKPAGKRRGRPKGSVNAPKKAASAAKLPAARPALRGPAELIDRLFELADEVGGMGALKRMVDRIAQVERA